MNSKDYSHEIEMHLAGDDQEVESANVETVTAVECRNPKTVVEIYRAEFYGLLESITARSVIAADEQDDGGLASQTLDHNMNDIRAIFERALAYDWSFDEFVEREEIPF